jgi:hypothetical protein
MQDTTVPMKKKIALVTGVNKGLGLKRFFAELTVN